MCLSLWGVKPSEISCKFLFGWYALCFVRNLCVPLKKKIESEESVLKGATWSEYDLCDCKIPSLWKEKKGDQWGECDFFCWFMENCISGFHAGEAKRRCVAQQFTLQSEEHWKQSTETFWGHLCDEMSSPVLSVWAWTGLHELGISVVSPLCTRFSFYLSLFKRKFVFHMGSLVSLVLFSILNYVGILVSQLLPRWKWEICWIWAWAFWNSIL